MIKYSFVLPAYKAFFFKEAIDSILAQTYQDFELIIVNDASPDDLDSIVNSYNDARIQYYVNEINIGGKDLVAQWNHCLKYANGKYIILASDDDIYSPLYLEKMDELVCQYPNIKIFRPRIQIIDSKSTVIHKLEGINVKVEQIEYIYHWMRGRIGSGIAHFIFNKEELINQGGFYNLPLAWGSDDITAIEMAKFGIGFSPYILFSFRNSGMNITSMKHDAYTMRTKLLSYKLFEEWLEKLIIKLGDKYNEDNFHFCYIKNRRVTFMREQIIYILRTSNISAIFKNIKNLFQIKCVTYIWGIFWLFRALIERIILYIIKRK